MPRRRKVAAIACMWLILLAGAIVTWCVSAPV